MFVALHNRLGWTEIDTALAGLPSVANVMLLEVRACNHTELFTTSSGVQAGPDAHLGDGRAGGP